MKSVTFVNAAARAAGAAAATDAAAGPGPGGGRPPGNADPAAGWRPQTWLGAPAPGGLALPSAQPTASWLYAPRGVYLGPADGRPTGRRGGSDGRLRSDAGRAAGQPGRPGGDVLVVADTGNHRVLIWHQAPERDEQPCDVVLGQPDAFSDGPAAGRGDSRLGLHLPTGVLMHEGKLVVADAWHHRVLIYDRLPQAPGAAPDLILGQPDPDSVAPNAGGGCRPSTLYWPFGIAIVGGRLYVADTGNRRVLGWSGGLPTSPGDRTRPDNSASPTGSAALRTAAPRPGRTASAGRTASPGRARTAGTGTVVSDAGRRRAAGRASPACSWLMRAITGCSAGRPGRTRTRPADLVLGQPDFAAATELPYGPQRADMLRFPYAIDTDGSTLAVADTANNRIVLWDRLARMPAGAGRDGRARAARVRAERREPLDRRHPRLAVLALRAVAGPRPARGRRLGKQPGGHLEARMTDQAHRRAAPNRRAPATATGMIWGNG